jgi:AAA+ ATPase superfamily predicted ATPase
VLEEELRTPGTYYSLLEELSTGRKSLSNLATALGRKTTDLQGYLRTLGEMRIVQRVAPVTAREAERNHRYRLADDFMRFWFRFVFPFQEDLKTGLPPVALYDDEIADALADHVSPTYEALCRSWILRTARATRVGSWWGNALNHHRRAGTRQTEEIDLVGLRDLETYKVPAMRQAKVRFAKDGPQIVLISKSGFKAGLVSLARQRDDLQLVDAAAVADDLAQAGGVR